MTDKDNAQLVRSATVAITLAEDVAEVWAVFSAAMAKFGLTYLAYGATRVPTWGIVGDGQEALILFEGPQEYANAYLGEELTITRPLTTGRSTTKALPVGQTWLRNRLKYQALSRDGYSSSISSMGALREL